MRYLVLAVIAFGFIRCESQVERVPLPKPEITKDFREDFKGKVKSITILECTKYYNNGTIDIDEKSCNVAAIYEFNRNGYLIKDVSWNSDDYVNPFAITEKTYDERGNLILSIHKQTGLFNLNSKDLYTYNKNGFVTEQIRYENNKLISRNEKIYDEYNCVIKEVEYDSNNNIVDIWKSKYNNLNQKIEFVQCDKTEKTLKKYLYEYSSENKNKDWWVLRIEYDKNDKEINRTDRSKKSNDYELNKIDYLWTDELPDTRFPDIEYYYNKKIKSWHFINMNDDDVYQTYNEKGLLIERKIMNNNIWKETYSFKYREDGALTEYSESTSQIIGKPYYKKTIYYKLDSSGNWIEKYSMDSEGKILELEQRKIVYY
jgi:hypothetical protein